MEVSEKGCEDRSLDVKLRRKLCNGCETERERDRHIDRHRQKDRKRKKERQADKQTER